MLQELKDLDDRQFAIVFLFVLGSVCPGALVIAMYAPMWMESLETTKFIIISLSITIPLIAINALAPVSAHLSKASAQLFSRNGLIYSFILGAVGAICVIYPVLIFAYFKKLEFPAFLIVLSFFEILIFVGLFFLERSTISKDGGTNS